MELYYSRMMLVRLLQITLNQFSKLMITSSHLIQKCISIRPKKKVKSPKMCPKLPVLLTIHFWSMASVTVGELSLCVDVPDVQV